MKCIYCGKELAEGELFCPACGKAVQIVPDYNVYDDDYLKEVLAQENPKSLHQPVPGEIRLLAHHLQKILIMERILNRKRNR